VSRKVLGELKQQIPLLAYLQAQDWQPARALSRGRWMGLCPLHTDHKPSFLVDPNKGLFYCNGCGRGGDVIRFAELYHQVNFPQAVALLRQWCGLAPLLNTVIDFYRIQLQRYNEAIVYLEQRGVRSSELMEHMRIGYAPGRCLRNWLTQLGYPLSVSSVPLASTAISDASFSHWKAICMAAASGVRHYCIDLCPDRKGGL
jgi:DNA primase